MGKIVRHARFFMQPARRPSGRAGTGGGGGGSLRAYLAQFGDLILSRGRISQLVKTALLAGFPFPKESTAACCLIIPAQPLREPKTCQLAREILEGVQGSFQPAAIIR